MREIFLCRGLSAIQTARGTSTSSARQPTNHKIMATIAMWLHRVDWDKIGGRGNRRLWTWLSFPDPESRMLRVYSIGGGAGIGFNSGALIVCISAKLTALPFE